MDCGHRAFVAPNTVPEWSDFPLTYARDRKCVYHPLLALLLRIRNVFLDVAEPNIDFPEDEKGSVLRVIGRGIDSIETLRRMAPVIRGSRNSNGLLDPRRLGSRFPAAELPKLRIIMAEARIERSSAVWRL